MPVMIEAILFQEKMDERIKQSHGGKAEARGLLKMKVLRVTTGSGVSQAMAAMKTGVGKLTPEASDLSKAEAKGQQGMRVSGGGQATVAMVVLMLGEEVG